MLFGWLSIFFFNSDYILYQRLQLNFYKKTEKKE